MADDKTALLKLVDIIYGASSLNMTPEACSKQAHRVARAILKQFDVTQKSPVTSGIRKSEA